MRGLTFDNSSDHEQCSGHEGAATNSHHSAHNFLIQQCLSQDIDIVCVHGCICVRIVCPCFYGWGVVAKTGGFKILYFFVLVFVCLPDYLSASYCVLLT